MRQPRSAKANPFPYRGSLVCYLSLDAAGSLTQVGHDFSSAAEAYRRAAAGEIRLYAVWPGEYSSDLFEIDDLNAFADAFGVERPDPHVHDLAWSGRTPMSTIWRGRSARWMTEHPAMRM